MKISNIWKFLSNNSYFISKIQIQMIQQFINYLNYPKTKEIFIHQKNCKKQGTTNKNNLICQTDQVIVSEPESDHHGQGKLIDQDKIQSLDGKNCSIQCQSHSLENVNQNQQIKKKQLKLRSMKYQQMKYFINFENFQEKLQGLQKNNKKQSFGDSKLSQSIHGDVDNEMSKPALLYILSVSQIISKLKKFMIPVYRNLCIEPKYSKSTKFMQVSPKQHYLLVIDEQSTIILTNLKQKCLKISHRSEQTEQITCIRWLNNGISFAIGTSTGNVIIWNISKDQQVNKIKTLTQQVLNMGMEKTGTCSITSIYCNKDYLYICYSDFLISKLSLKTYKVCRIIDPKCTELTKIIKIQIKVLKNLIFGIERTRTEILMIDEITGFYTSVFEINRFHGTQYRNLELDENVIGEYKNIGRYCWIEDIVVNQCNNCLIVSVAGINPSIYEIDPQRNEVRLKLNYKSFKQNEPTLQHFQKHTEYKISNIHMSLSHKSQLLVVTTNSRKIFFVRLKNWRILYEHKEMENDIKFGKVSASKRLCDTQQKIQYHTLQLSSGQSQQINSENESLKQRQSILCVENIQTGNIELYENEKIKLKTIKKDIPKQNRSTSMGTMGTNRFSLNAPGFLQILQSIRENYQGLV